MSTQAELSWIAALRTLDAALDAIEQLAWAAREGIANGTQSLDQVRARGRRHAKAGWALARMGTAYRFHRTRAAFTTRASAGRAAERLHTKQARRFRESCEELGGAFLKVGQLLSARPDLMPAVWIEELSSLRDAAPHVSWEAIREVLEEELGPLSEVFAEIDETPVAAASIGQVHEARTLDGQRVAVKVKRPGVDELVQADLALMERFVVALNDALPVGDVARVRGEIRAGVMEELDYDLEHIRMRRIAAFLEDVPGVRAPTPVAELSTARVLTASFEDGVPITDHLDALVERREQGDQQASVRVDDVLETVLDTWVRMVLEAGLFQADPHPGNVLVDANDQLIVLDFGCSMDVTDEMRAGYLDFLMAFLGNDREGLARSLFALGFETESGDPATLLAFADSMLGHLRNAIDGDADWPSSEELLADAAALMKQAESDVVVRLPEGFVMLARVFGTLGGLFVNYRPTRLGSRTLPTLQRALSAT